MKAIKIESCQDCNTKRKLHCVYALTPKGINHNCPLPDWPSMNRDKAMKIYAKIQGTIGGMAVTSKFQTFLDELHSIGVEIKEGK